MNTRRSELNLNGLEHLCKALPLGEGGGGGAGAWKVCASLSSWEEL
jgi:hypothetical protein